MLLPSSAQNLRRGGNSGHTVRRALYTLKISKFGGKHGTCDNCVYVARNIFSVFGNGGQLLKHDSDMEISIRLGGNV